MTHTLLFLYGAAVFADSHTTFLFKAAKRNDERSVWLPFSKLHSLLLQNTWDCKRAKRGSDAYENLACLRLKDDYPEAARQMERLVDKPRSRRQEQSFSILGAVQPAHVAHSEHASVF